jgi:hypothetical protein
MSGRAGTRRSRLTIRVSARFAANILVRQMILEEKRVYSTLFFHQEKSFQDHSLPGQVGLAALAQEAERLTPASAQKRVKPDGLRAA